MTDQPRDLLRDYVCELLTGYGREIELLNQRARQLEADGHRIVDGGRRGAGQGWRYRDWRTGQTLAEGDEQTPYPAEIGPGGTWHHPEDIAPIGHAIPDLPEGLPASLAELVMDWVNETATEEEIATLAGWPVARVRRCREVVAHPNGTAQLRAVDAVDLE